MSGEIEKHIESKRAFGKAVCQRISESIAKLGFPLQTDITLPNYDTAVFSVCFKSVKKLRKAKMPVFWQ